MPASKLSRFRASNLRLRLLSSLALAPLVLLAVYFGGWIFASLVALTVAIGLYEWLRLIDPRLPRPFIIFSVAALLLVLLLAAWPKPNWSITALAILTFIFFSLVGAVRKKGSSRIAFGLPYMAGSGMAMIYLRSLPGVGMASIIYLFAIVWGTDIGAYAAGRLIGGPKLAPAISPNKTWAGFFGGMALAAALGYGVSNGFGLWKPGLAVGMALGLSIVSQMGDLFKSFFKRRAGVKDSGRLIPGHGGVLDRIDGLVFAAVGLALAEIIVLTVKL